MDMTIASILALDGVTNGSVYALLALATVLVFAVTRVIFVPQGEFVAFGAPTLAMFQLGQGPGPGWVRRGVTGRGGDGGAARPRALGAMAGMTSGKTSWTWRLSCPCWICAAHQPAR